MNSVDSDPSESECFCSDFQTEAKGKCEDRGFTWFQCPEDYPHADSKVRNGLAKIPVCYSNLDYALRGYGPKGSWCDLIFALTVEP